jgi:hypothetical protein
VDSFQTITTRIGSVLENMTMGSFSNKTLASWQLNNSNCQLSTNTAIPQDTGVVEPESASTS